MFVHELCNDDQLIAVLANAATVNWELLHSAIECEGMHFTNHIIIIITLLSFSSKLWWVILC